jgi:hypothetical protein
MKTELYGVYTPMTSNPKDEKIKLIIEKKKLRDYMPKFIVYLYADIKFQIEKLRNFKQLRRHFNEKVGYSLDLKNPRTYNEKINWKKIHDRNPLLTVTADKYEVRSYLKSVLGEKEAEKYLIPLYYITRNPENIPFDKLPDSFVIKPNHGSRMHLIVHNKSELITGDVIDQCKEWLKVHFGLFSHEWAYKHIKRKIIIEKLLLSENNELPCDYRFFCFHGECRFIRASHNRFSDSEESTYLDINWNPLPVHNPGYEISEVGFERPSKLAEMINLAEKLSKAFDSVRVDLYYIDEMIYFGELTHYRSNGMARFEPQSYDLEFGGYWNLEWEYWKKGRGNLTN